MEKTAEKNSFALSQNPIRLPTGHATSVGQGTFKSAVTLYALDRGCQSRTMHGQLWPTFRKYAISFLEFIKGVWVEDRQGLEDIPCQSPDRGMLKALGYRVGEAGVETALRRLILDYLLTEDALPAIHGLGYVREWGLASEETRAAKLRSALSNLSDGKKFDIEHSKAVRE